MGQATHFKTNRLIGQFAARTPARTAAALVGVNKISATSFYHKLLEIIYVQLLEEADELVQHRLERDRLTYHIHCLLLR